MELISVIVPVYNSEKYIEKCIKSILNQSYKDVEIIAIDDGSNDKSLQILNKIAKIDSRLKVFAKQNGGVSSARNYGIERASGTFISFVDSDDMLPENALQTLINSIDSSVDIVSGCQINVKFKKEYLSPVKLRVKGCEKYSRFADYDFMCWGPCGKLYRKAIIDKYNVRFDNNITYGEDHMFNLDYVKHIKNDFLVIEDYVYIYNNRLRDNLCSKSLENIAEMELALLKKAIAFFDGQEMPNTLYNDYLYATFNGAIEHYLVFFKPNQYKNLVEKAFTIFSDYMSNDFLEKYFSEKQAENINNHAYNEFINQYIYDNKNIKKRRIKNAIKKALKLIAF